jgi:hypothetical protein
LPIPRNSDGEIEQDQDQVQENAQYIGIDQVASEEQFPAAIPAPNIS